MLLPRPNGTRGLYYSALRLRRLYGGLPNLTMPMRSLRNLPANRRILGIFHSSRASRRRIAGWYTVATYRHITPLPNCPRTFPCKCPNIPNGILCCPGDFIFRVIAGRIRLLRLLVRCLLSPTPDKVPLHLPLGCIHYRLPFMLPCLDFRQWRRLLSGLTGKPPLTGAGGHKLVELGIFRKTVDERNEGTAVFDNPTLETAFLAQHLCFNPRGLHRFVPLTGQVVTAYCPPGSGPEEYIR